MTGRELHDCRQKILMHRSVIDSISLECQLKQRIQPYNYIYEDEYSAVFLYKTCKYYHNLPIKYVAEQMSSLGKLKCPFCDVECFNTEDIILDALVTSYFHKAKVLLFSSLELSRGLYYIRQKKKRIYKSGH